MGRILPCLILTLGLALDWTVNSECRVRGNRMFAKDRQNSTGTKIYGGNMARPHQFPWHVALFQDNYYICSASIVNDMTVLTAAHCIDQEAPSASRYIIGAGMHDLSSSNNWEQVIDVDSIIMHEQYDDYEIENDIALLKLSTPLVLNIYVKPIQLSTSSFDLLALKRKYRCYNAGWGEASPGYYPDIIRWVRVKLVSNKGCSRILRPYSYDIFDTNLCTAERNKGSCRGDSGGPMFCMDQEGKAVQLGIVSWSLEDCNLPPHVNTRVSSYLPWILTNMASGTSCGSQRMNRQNATGGKPEGIGRQPKVNRMATN